MAHQRHSLSLLYVCRVLGTYFIAQDDEAPLIEQQRPSTLRENPADVPQPALPLQNPNKHISLSRTMKHLWLSSKGCHPPCGTSGVLQPALPLQHPDRAHLLEQDDDAHLVEQQWPSSTMWKPLWFITACSASAEYKEAHLSSRMMQQPWSSSKYLHPPCKTLLMHHSLPCLCRIPRSASP